MTMWGVPAFIAALTRPLRLAGRVTGQSYPQASEAPCPTAQPTSGTPSPDVMPLLERRAQRVSNRDRKMAAKYMATHRALINSNSFEG